MAKRKAKDRPLDVRIKEVQRAIRTLRANRKLAEALVLLEE